MRPRTFHFSKKKLATIIATLLVALLSSWMDSLTIFGDSDSGEASFGRIIYTHHAQCRMGCRKITKAEIDDVLKNGKKNLRKSNAHATPCPVVAKEKRTVDGQMARVVYAKCPGKTKIITVIDLKKKHHCNCK